MVPFYLSWDPTSSRIAYLGSPSEEDIELAILEVAGRSSGTPLDAGQPFYLSWAPGGDQLLVHVGEDRLELLDLDGSLTTVADRPGTSPRPCGPPTAGPSSTRRSARSVSDSSCGTPRPRTNGRSSPSTS